jgi:hypothetical protein
MVRYSYEKNVIFPNAIDNVEGEAGDDPFAVATR